MAAPVHDFFSNLLANDIERQLQQTADHGDGNDAIFARQITNGGSSRILLEIAADDHQSDDCIPALRRHPDAQFQHEGAEYPGVIIEVSNSQDGKSLEKLAWQYIQYSNGDIKAVVGIDIGYGTKSTTSSTVSLWRPEYTREEGDDLHMLGVCARIDYQPFRSPAREGVNGTQELRLALSDFATDPLTQDLSNKVLCISFERLAELLGRAEEMQRVREQDSGIRVKSTRRVRRRRRLSSPADRILSEDEIRYQEQEKNAINKAAAEDEDFEPW